jgi:hypothetical protein
MEPGQRLEGGQKIDLPSAAEDTGSVCILTQISLTRAFFSPRQPA